jgi:MFS transporter, FSR family, fosmidomycin resistance protein
MTSQALFDKPRATATGPTFSVLIAASICHFLNDLMQSVFTATYPVFKAGFGLTFGQIGLLTLTYQMCASIFQPLIGFYTDSKPQPYSLPLAMAFSLAGLLTLSMAPTYALLLLGGAVLGVGSSIFHPETSRVARLAAGTSHGLAQSIFQVGGNLGSSIGPLLVAFIVLPRGLITLSWFAFAALTAMIILTGISLWYAKNGHAKPRVKIANREGALSQRKISGVMVVLTLLMLSKYFYLASFNSYYIFYLVQNFSVSTKDAQVCLFAFLGAVAVGTFVGGPIGDRIGRKNVIWGSILGVLPFTLALPYAGLPLTIALSIIIGFVLASAFSAIVVYAQSLMPDRIGMISGVFFGLSFGLGGLGAALLGRLADWTSIVFVYKVCSFLPLMGLLAALLPDVENRTVQPK